MVFVRSGLGWVRLDIHIGADAVRTQLPLRLYRVRNEASAARSFVCEGETVY